MEKQKEVKYLVVSDYGSEYCSVEKFSSKESLLDDLKSLFGTTGGQIEIFEVKEMKLELIQKETEGKK